MSTTCRGCHDLGYTDAAYTPCARCARGKAVADVNTALAFLEPNSLSQAQRDRRACVVCARRLPKTDRPVQLPGGAWAGACNPCCGANGVENELLPAAAPIVPPSVPETAHLTADVALFGADAAGDLHVLLIKRRWEPFQGRWALPGGHLDEGEATLRAAHRELHEETGIRINTPPLTLAGVYADPGRDPRGRYVTFAYTATLPDVLGMLPNPAASDDAADARWVLLDDALTGSVRLAFDHHRIITEALRAAHAESARMENA